MLMPWQPCRLLTSCMALWAIVGTIFCRACMASGVQLVKSMDPPSSCASVQEHANHGSGALLHSGAEQALVRDLGGVCCSQEVHKAGIAHGSHGQQLQRPQRVSYLTIQPG